jgi:hypothetical protein
LSREARNGRKSSIALPRRPVAILAIFELGLEIAFGNGISVSAIRAVGGRENSRKKPQM